MQYLCPNCQLLMKNFFADAGMIDYCICKKCNIDYDARYFKMYVGDDPDVFYKGTFEECCRAFKLISFS